MLGRFLEFSLATPDIQASFNFYTKLGFTQAAVGEAWPHPYAVVTDGRICLGLHEHEQFAPSLTFVKPNLLKHLNALQAFGLEFEFSHLGNDVFNEVAWCDPSGQLIRLIEARTFSPAKRAKSATSLCGYFTEIALPAPDMATAKAYWEAFGFVGIDELEDRWPHVSCTSDFIDLGLYDPAQLRRPALRFEVDDLAAALARLAALGIAPVKGLLLAPEGTPLLLVGPN